MVTRKWRFDKRPICDCNAYDFPHRIGGKCKGQDFTLYHFFYDKAECKYCNCNCETYCDVAEGIENIKQAECHRAATLHSPGGHLPLHSTFLEEQYYES